MSNCCRCSYWLMENSYIDGGFSMAATQLWQFLRQRAPCCGIGIWGFWKTAVVYYFRFIGSFPNPVLSHPLIRLPSLYTQKLCYRRHILTLPLDIPNMIEKLCSLLISNLMAPTKVINKWFFRDLFFDSPFVVPFKELKFKILQWCNKLRKDKERKGADKTKLFGW